MIDRGDVGHLTSAALVQAETASMATNAARTLRQAIIAFHSSITSSVASEASFVVAVLIFVGFLLSRRSR